MRAGIDIDTMLQRRHRRRDRTGPELQPIRPPRDQVLVPHPDQGGGELVGKLGTRLRSHQQIATRNVDLVEQRQRHRITRDGPIERTIEGNDLLHHRLPA